MRTHRRVGLIGGIVASTVMAVALGVGGASAAPFPVTTDAVAATTSGLRQAATASPPGSNRPDCRDRHGRNPVILVHGTASNQSSGGAFLAPTLANAGYCVFSLTYGRTSWSGNVGALGRKDRSIRQVREFVEHVLTTTRARTVDLIGHSQGGAIVQQIAQLPGMAPRLGTVVGLAAPDPVNVAYLSMFTERLPATADKWGPRHRNIHYVNIITMHDTIVAPPLNSFMTPAPNVTNIRVQDACPRSQVGHLGLIFSPTVGALIRNQLDPAHRVAVPCGRDFTG